MNPTLVDDILGELQYDEQLGWYRGQLDVQDKLVCEMLLSVEPSADLEPLVAFARQFVQNITDVDRRARQYAADNLLELCNDVWNQDSVISISTFIKRIALESVVLYPDCSAELFYNDGDLFWGHVIIVSMNTKARFTDATIAG